MKKRGKDTSKYSFLFSYVDMLSAILMAIFVLFMLSFLLINVQKVNKDTGKVDTDAQIQVVMTWKPDGIANDIDLWVKPPTGVPIGYSHLLNTYMYLSRDDLGEANDYAIVNGKRVPIPGHVEVTSIRRCEAGNYVVNAHFYAIHAMGDGTIDVTTPVTVKLIQINPYRLLASESFELHQQGEQHTAFSFTCDESGKVTDVDTTKQVPFVYGKSDDGSSNSAPGTFPSSPPASEGPRQ